MSRRLAHRFAVLPVAFLALSLLAACGGDDDKAEDPGGEPDTSVSPPPDRQPTGVMCTYNPSAQGANKANNPPPEDAVVSGQLDVTFDTTLGTLHGTLDADKTPCTVNSFASLADQNYFNANDCHRLTTSGIYVVQCGDPSATGTGGPGYSFDDELDGSETYGPGTLAMANAGPNTNGSQFFMVYEESPLPPSYTVFGSIDEDAVALLVKAAAEGTDDSNGPGDGRPIAEIELHHVSVGG